MGDLDRDTRLTQVDGREGHYRLQLCEDWNIWGPNGGCLACIALRAAGLEAKVLRPASFHAHFLSVARFEEVDVEVTPLRVGRRSESFRVSIRQGTKLIVEAMIRTAVEGPGLEHDVSRMPDVPGPAELRNLEELRKDFGMESENGHAFWMNLERRPTDPEAERGDWKPGLPEFVQWHRFRPRACFDDPFLDAGRALLLLDTLTWPAAVQPHAPDPQFTAPNLDVTAWFHNAVPEEEWLLADVAGEIAAGGLMGTSGRGWGPKGKLVASGGAQLFCVPNPSG